MSEIAHLSIPWQPGPVNSRQWVDGSSTSLNRREVCCEESADAGDGEEPVRCGGVRHECDDVEPPETVEARVDRVPGVSAVLAALYAVGCCSGIEGRWDLGVDKQRNDPVEDARR